MENKKQEKRRKRKKKLLNSIREQIEFYFSDANLRHDRFMRQLVGAEDNDLMGRKSVDLKEFLKFNKISEMTKKIRDISLSLESSKCLSLDQLTVKRNEPFVAKEDNYDESTVYVERLPPNADQQWIRSVFGPFGEISYIKIPHFRHNHNIMGFAFIEFSKPEFAQKAVKHFTTDHKNQSHSESDPELPQTSGSSQSENNTKTDVSRKRTHESDAEEVTETKKTKISEENQSKDKSEEIEDNCETNVKNKKKKKRKRKRKAVTTPPAEDNLHNESEVINLRVMSKKEWKRWKNKYLKLQKQTMSSIKKSLLVDNENENRDKCDNQTKVENNCEDREDRHYESGLIIKLNFVMPSKDLNEYEFKRNIRQMAAKNQIQYIDLPLNRLEFCPNQTVNGICYIRTNSGDDCRQLVANQRLKQLGEPSVLEGKEETDYWNQIFEQRIKKKSNNENNKNRTKVRGFDRIINRAENLTSGLDTKPNKHLKFET